MATRKRACLLTLRGVFMRDLIAAPVAAPAAPEPSVSYTEMPKKFSGVADWIKSSNLLCWRCSLPHNNTPMFIPLNPSPDECDVFGHFCTMGCAAAYARTHFPRDQVPDILESIARFEAKFTGKRRLIVVGNPPHTEMRAYCGNTGLSVDQWRAKCASVQADYAFGA